MFKILKIIFDFLFKKNQVQRRVEFSFTFLKYFPDQNNFKIRNRFNLK